MKHTAAANKDSGSASVDSTRAVARGDRQRIALVEKKDHLAVHGYFDTMASAERHLKNTIPVYVAKRYFMDKTLTANDFEIIIKG